MFQWIDAGTGTRKLLQGSTALLLGFAFPLMGLFFTNAPRVIRDIKYLEIGEESLKLDVCIPGGEGPHPVVVVVHGGGWSGGDKQGDISTVFDALTEGGFAWFTINYRLAPQHRWPACLEDVQTAVRWVRDHAKEYNVDPDRLALMGYSAGGHLACMAAVQAKDGEKVQAVIGLAPPVDLEADSERRGGLSQSLQNLFGRPAAIDEEARAILRENSPIRYVHADLPPFLLIHGTEDKSVLYHQSTDLQTKLAEFKVPCKLVTVQGAPHRITEWEQYHPTFRRELVNWLSQALHKKLTVAPDGTGDFTTVQAAVDAVPEGSTQPVTIAIQPGVYKERIVVPRSKRFLRFVGQDAEKTVLTFDLYAGIKGPDGKEIGTFRTPSVTIEADDFTAENVTFENSAGPVGQAVALAVLGDRAVFRNCRFLGWQDTLLDQTGRHYYENCCINGHCDYIFGGGTAWFENCRIHNLDASYITAASTPEHQPYGYVFSNCTITGEPEGKKTYLGRPWRDYASVIFLNCRMEDCIQPEGWHNWGKPHREKTAFYAEYNSAGPIADPQHRVPWSHQLTDQQAQVITLQNVLGGNDGWDPLTGRVQTELKVLPVSAAEAQTLKKKIADNYEKEGASFLAVAQKEGGEGLFWAHSEDGLAWVGAEAPFFENERAMLRPSLCRAKPGGFCLVWQVGQGETCEIGWTRSEDLVHWSPPGYIKPMQGHDALDVTVPTLYQETVTGKCLLIWASTLPGNYYQCYQEPVEDNPRLWVSTTADFKEWTPAIPFFEPGYTVREALLIDWKADKALIHTDSRARFQTIRTSFAHSSEGPWGGSIYALPQTGRFLAAVKVRDDLIVYYRSPEENVPGAVMTRDFQTWRDLTPFIDLPAGTRLESILRVPREIANAIRDTNGARMYNGNDNEPVKQ